MQHSTQLAAAAFAIGIVALLWVFRRTLLRARHPSDGQDVGSFRTRALTAEAAIDEISAREWLVTWRSALKFHRGAEMLTAQQQQLLANLTVWQNSHRRPNEP